MTRRSMLVTGATGAVGSALIEMARAGGWDVVGLYYRNEDKAERLRATWSDVSSSLEMRSCDLGDPERVQALIDDFSEDYCPDALVHLAAPKIQLAPIQRMPWEEYQRELDLIVKPLVMLARPLLKRMARRGTGRIISVLSAVVLGSPPRGFATYTTAKHALAGYMKCLSAEYAGRGITANMVSPASMQTPLLENLPALLTDQMRAAIPGGQWIDPRAVASIVFWLAAEAGPEVTGCNIPVTFGMTF